MKLADETFGQAWMMTIPSGPDINDEERGHWYSPSAVAQFVSDEREACAKTCEALKYKHEYVRACVDAIRMRSNVEHNRRPQGVRVDGPVGPLAKD